MGIDYEKDHQKGYLLLSILQFVAYAIVIANCVKVIWYASSLASSDGVIMLTIMYSIIYCAGIWIVYRITKALLIVRDIHIERHRRDCNSSKIKVAKDAEESATTEQEPISEIHQDRCEECSGDLPVGTENLDDASRGV